MRCALLRVREKLPKRRRRSRAGKPHAFQQSGRGAEGFAHREPWTRVQIGLTPPWCLLRGWRAATLTKFACVRRHELTVSIEDLDLQMRMDAADRADAAARPAIAW